MIKLQDYSELVEQAVNGDDKALSRLAESVYGSLRSYILRITLSEDMTDDIVQGTILEMYKIFGQLRNSDRFWPWLCKIALNKIRSSSTKQNRQKRLLEKHAEELSNRNINIEGLTNVINGEIKQAIFQAMAKLSDQQKAILSLRCFENMPYSRIAYVMNLSEFNSRIIFHRAKKKLQKHLCISGFSKKTLLPALIIFGKLTAPTEAAASGISLTPSVLSAGVMATTISTATTKTAIVLATGSMIGVGLVTNSAINNSDNAEQVLQSSTNPIVLNNSAASDISIEGYYYYPNGSAGPVMTRLTVSTGKTSYKVLQNNYGNYFVEDLRNEVVLRNRHYWNRDMSVMSLPTDDKRFCELIGSDKNRSLEIPARVLRSQNLLYTASKNDENGVIDFSVHRYDAMMEERFQYNWPSDSTVVDHRDDIHKQGWCYVAMDGSYKDRKITGLGRIAFGYTASRRTPSLLTVNIGKDTAISVSDEISLLETSDGVVTSSLAGTLYMGLNKPWMGLHCIDTVRRDAALNGIAFKTELYSDETLCKVTLLHENGTIEYTIDMNKDLIEEISFLDESGISCGRILFEYSTIRPVGYKQLKMPASDKYTGAVDTKPMHWLAELALGKL